MTKNSEPMYQKRRIVAWLYRSSNSTWGYDAILSCGHRRTDLSAQFGGHRGRITEALCWECKPTEESNAT